MLESLHVCLQIIDIALNALSKKALFSDVIFVSEYFNSLQSTEVKRQQTRSKFQ